MGKSILIESKGSIWPGKIMKSMHNVIIIINSKKFFNIASIRFRHCLKVYEITCKMTKHLSIYKMQHNTASHTVPRNIFYKKNGFSMAKAEAMLLLIESISKKETLYKNAFNKKALALD